MVSLSALGEHRNDPSQHRLTLCVMSSTQHFAGFETVLNRCAFQRRAASDLEEAAPIGIGPLTVAFLPSAMFSAIDCEARGSWSRAGRSLPFKLLATWYAQATYRIETR
jgi:hypothetical protein